MPMVETWKIAWHGAFANPKDAGTIDHATKKDLLHVGFPLKVE